MSDPAETELLTRLRALRTAPPESGFELRLRERLEAEPSPTRARPATVIGLKRWVRSRRVALALAAAAFPMAVYAAAGSWIGATDVPKAGPSADLEVTEQPQPVPQQERARSRASQPAGVDPEPKLGETRAGGASLQRVPMVTGQREPAAAAIERRSVGQPRPSRDEADRSARSSLASRSTDQDPATEDSSAAEPASSTQKRAAERLRIRVGPGPSASARGSAPRLRDEIRSSGRARQHGSEGAARGGWEDGQQGRAAEHRERAGQGAERGERRERGPNETRRELRSRPR
jgi:hypothetical protein